MRQQHEALHTPNAGWPTPSSPQVHPPLAPSGVALLPLAWECPGPQLLIVMPARAGRTEFSERLSEAGYAVAITEVACEALDYAEQAPLDGIVLDLDALYEVGAGQAMLSGFRLLELLWRAVRARPTALVVLTALDYAELDDVLRRRVDALLDRSSTPAQILARLEAALAKVSQRRQSGGLALAVSPPAAHVD